MESLRKEVRVALLQAHCPWMKHYEEGMTGLLWPVIQKEQNREGKMKKTETGVALWAYVEHPSLIEPAVTQEEKEVVSLFFDFGFPRRSPETWLHLPPRHFCVALDFSLTLPAFLLAACVAAWPLPPPSPLPEEVTNPERPDPRLR